MGSEMCIRDSLDSTDFLAAQETYHSNGWTDGLPVVPPSPELVSACLEWAMLPPDHLVGIEPVRERLITAEKLAVNSVMAGCLPEHFPLVVTAFTAMLEPDFLLHGATASTGGCAVLLIVNGPIRHQLQMTGTFNALGNTDRASAVVGRAVRLALINLLDVRPGEIDRSTLGHPGKFSYCLVEDEENSPWSSLAEERLGDSDVSAVTAVAAMAPRQIMNEWTTNPKEICDTIDNDCDGIPDNGMVYDSKPLAQLCDGVGACGTGVVECNTQLEATCSPNPDGTASEAAIEICEDSSDNDCDGLTDEVDCQPGG